MQPTRLLNGSVYVQGHVAPSQSRAKGIYHPHWVQSAHPPDSCGILCAGEGLHKLSLYDADSGATISRGSIGFDASALAADKNGILAAAGGKTRGILLLQPSFKPWEPPKKINQA